MTNAVHTLNGGRAAADLAGDPVVHSGCAPKGLPGGIRVPNLRSATRLADCPMGGAHTWTRQISQTKSSREICMRGHVAAKPLLNRPEQILYSRLVRAFPGHIVLSQVALCRLLTVEGAGTVAGAGGQAIANRFRQMVADFVVCRPDFTALAVVELDPCARPRDAERERDCRKDRFLQAAGVKVIRLPANDIPCESAIKALVASLPLNSSNAERVRRAS
jgi:hypothetical protein